MIISKELNNLKSLLEDNEEKKKQKEKIEEKKRKEIEEKQRKTRTPYIREEKSNGIPIPKRINRNYVSPVDNSDEEIVESVTIIVPEEKLYKVAVVIYYKGNCKKESSNIKAESAKKAEGIFRNIPRIKRAMDKTSSNIIWLRTITIQGNPDTLIPMLKLQERKHKAKDYENTKEYPSQTRNSSTTSSRKSAGSYK